MALAYERCKKCDHWGFSDTHRCPPEFEWRCADYGDDEWRELFARDEDAAATKAAEKYDEEGEYHLIRDESHSVMIQVRNPRTGKVLTYRCRGESVPQYHASLVSGE